MDSIVWIAVATLAMLAFVTLVDRVPPAWGFAGFLALAPVALFFRSTGPDQASFFSLIKMIAVAVGAAYIQGTKITRWTEHPVGRAVGFAILAANILEASASEAMQGGYVNAAAGVLLVLAQPSPRTIHVTRDEGRADLRYPLGALWVAAYVAWNVAFVYGRETHGAYAINTAMAVVHLGVPLLAMRRQSDLFIQYRAFALTPLMVVRLVAPHPPFLARTPLWYHPTIANALRVVSAVLAVAVVVKAWRRARSDGSPRAVDGGQVI